MVNLNLLPHNKQNGIALPLTLILLFAMTLLGIATLRTTTIEQNMSAKSRFRQVAFNAAAPTLRDAELNIQTLTGNGRRNICFTSTGGRVFSEPSNIRQSTSELCQAGPNGGFCIPTQYNSQVNPNFGDTLERWEDPALDVFNVCLLYTSPSPRD